MKRLILIFLILLIGCHKVGVPISHSNSNIIGQDIPTIEISGETVYALTDSDYYSPRFSPQSNFLAYAKQSKKRGQRISEVYVRDLRNNNTIQIIDSDEAKKYAAYHTIVTDINWLDSDTCEITLWDGDIDSVVLEYSVPDVKLEKDPTSYSEETLSDDLVKISEKVHDLEPKWSKDAIEQALRHATVIDDENIIMQVRQYGFSNDILHWDLKAGQKKTLIKESSQYTGNLLGGVALTRSIILPLEKEKNVRFMKVEDNTVNKLGSINIDYTRNPDVKYRLDNRAIFSIGLNKWEKKNNPLLLFDKDALFLMNACKNLSDADFNRKGDLAALSCWDGENRHIFIKKINIDADLQSVRGTTTN
jgi:hypothetical protein